MEKGLRQIRLASLYELGDALRRTPPQQDRGARDARSPHLAHDKADAADHYLVALDRYEAKIPAHGLIERLAVEAPRQRGNAVERRNLDERRRAIEHELARDVVVASSPIVAEEVGKP